LLIVKTFSAAKQGFKKLRECLDFHAVLLSHNGGRGGGGLKQSIIGQLDNGTLARMRQEKYNDDDEL
jgi:hypothetical protein